MVAVVVKFIRAYSSTIIMMAVIFVMVINNAGDGDSVFVIVVALVMVVM